jgi:hypothetical protein
MWWHGGAGLIERSERGSLSAVATHDVFGDSCFCWLITAKDEELIELPRLRRQGNTLPQRS